MDQLRRLSRVPCHSGWLPKCILPFGALASLLPTQLITISLWIGLPCFWKAVNISKSYLIQNNFFFNVYSRGVWIFFTPWSWEINCTFPVLLCYTHILGCLSNYQERKNSLIYKFFFLRSYHKLLVQGLRMCN